jgi:hypothetical protein
METNGALVNLLKMLFSVSINILGKFLGLFVPPSHFSHHEVAGMVVILRLVGVMVSGTSSSIPLTQMRVLKLG